MHQIHWGDFPTWGLFITALLAAGASGYAAFIFHRQLGVQQREFQGTRRPVVVDVMAPYNSVASASLDVDPERARWSRPTGAISLTVPVRNVGAGPAIVYGSWFGGPENDAQAEVDHEVIPVGETAIISFNADESDSVFPAVQAGTQPGGEFEVTLSYFDLGGQRFQSVIRLTTRVTTSYADVREVELRRCVPPGFTVAEVLISGRRHPPDDDPGLRWDRPLPD